MKVLCASKKKFQKAAVDKPRVTYRFYETLNAIWAQEDLRRSFKYYFHLFNRCMIQKQAIYGVINFFVIH